jgi:hypothetical protein
VPRQRAQGAPRRLKPMISIIGFNLRGFESHAPYRAPPFHALDRRTPPSRPHDAVPCLFGSHVRASEQVGRSNMRTSESSAPCLTRPNLTRPNATQPDRAGPRRARPQCTNRKLKLTIFNRQLQLAREKLSRSLLCQSTSDHTPPFIASTHHAVPIHTPRMFERPSLSSVRTCGR